VSLLEADGQRIQSAGGCYYQPWLTRFRPALVGMNKDVILQANIQPLDYISGAALFISNDVINTVGLLNEEYFLYYEELDYCQRLKRAGYSIGWCRSAMMVHKGSATIGANSDNKQQRILANYYENLSTLKYSRNFHPRSLWLILFNRFVFKSIFIVLRREWYLFAPLWQAYRDFFKAKKNGASMHR
jgi:GT2 family glycosyltransferase